MNVEKLAMLSFVAALFMAALGELIYEMCPGLARLFTAVAYCSGFLMLGFIFTDILLK